MSHTTIRNNHLFCLHCGGEFPLKYPMKVGEFSKKTNAFEVLHKDCEKTWVEPEPSGHDNWNARAHQWMRGAGQRGASSECMWHVFMSGHPRADKAYPHDPDDFSRCYKLLKWVPEWKERMPEMAQVSDRWKRLVDNWDKLTEMYEQNVREEWKNSNEIGMYELMQKIINP